MGQQKLHGISEGPNHGGNPLNKKKSQKAQEWQLNDLTDLISLKRHVDWQIEEVLKMQETYCFL